MNSAELDSCLLLTQIASPEIKRAEYDKAPRRSTVVANLFSFLLHIDLDVYIAQDI